MRWSVLDGFPGYNIMWYLLLLPNLAPGYNIMWYLLLLPNLTWPTTDVVVAFVGFYAVFHRRWMIFALPKK